MSNERAECSCVIDCSGLCEIARTKSNNLKSLYLNRLKDGTIAVSTRSWDEFKEAYPDESATLAPYVSKKIRMNQAHHIGAARLAEKLNSGFSRGPYDGHSELYTASVATLEEYTILTSADQLAVYKRMGCAAVDLVSWASDEGS